MLVRIYYCVNFILLHIVNDNNCELKSALSESKRFIASRMKQKQLKETNTTMGKNIIIL